ncbi:MAG: hypothetical protein U0324_39945 [Polyangiales bacterium]
MRDAPPDVLSAQPRARAELVQHGVVFALTAGLAAGLSPLAAPLTAALIVAAVGLAASAVARRWNDRVELHPDRLVERRGRSVREVPLDDVVGLDVDGPAPHLAPSSDPPPPWPVAVTVRVKRGAAVVLRGDRDDLAPLVDALNEALLRRMLARLDRGETIAFADRGAPPVLWVVAAGVASAAWLTGAASVWRGVVRRDSLEHLLVGALLTVALVACAVGTLRHWRASRESRGLVVSSRGLLPLADARAGAAAATAYREAHGGAGPWIPWEEVAWHRHDALGLTVQCDARPAPIVLGARTESLLLLDLLLAAHTAVEGPDAPQGPDADPHPPGAPST